MLALNPAMDRVTTRGLLDILKGGPGRSSKRLELLVLLQLSAGRCVTEDQAIDYIWGGSDGGGPLWARGSLALYAMDLRSMGYNVRARQHAFRLMPEIKRGIPIPSASSGWVFDWRRLGDDESFFEPLDTADRRVVNRVRSAMFASARQANVRITTRSIVLEGVPGVMGWIR